MTKPDPDLTFSQALLGIQVLALDHEGLEVLDYEPKYTPPKRSYTFSAKATHAKAQADALHRGENKATAVSTSLALSKSTLFSISGTQTKTYSYLKVSAATDTETKEEGVSVTLVSPLRASSVDILVKQLGDQSWCQMKLTSCCCSIALQI